MPWRQSKPAALTQSQANLATYLLIAVVFLIFATKNAWLSDDSYITFRTINNFLSGYGLVYNVAERVQAYTHPLWLFLLAPLKLIFGQIYYPVIIISLVASLAAVLLVIKSGADRWSGIVAFATLLVSKAFMDYTTSGLENPLSYFLIGLFVLYALQTLHDRKKLTVLFLIASALALNRLDSLLLTLPVLLYMSWRVRKQNPTWSTLIGLSPLILWTLFSLLYYGAPVANTAYAKLDTGIPASVLVRQGFFYLADSLGRDPITLVVIIVGCALALRRKRALDVCLAIGIAAYLTYVVLVGGDFMAGRFLSMPFFVAVLLLARQKVQWNTGLLAAVGVVILLLSIPSWKSNLFSGSHYGDVPLTPTSRFGPLPISLISKHGISDERAFYYQATGLFRPHPGSFPTHQWARTGLEDSKQGHKVTVGYALGFYGYYAGPDVYIVDVFGLDDFLLARLPLPKGAHWRIGHFARPLPMGYYESIINRNNQIIDPRLAEFYDAVELVIKSPLFSPGRLSTIWKMNTGGYSHLVEEYVSGY